MSSTTTHPGGGSQAGAARAQRLFATLACTLGILAVAIPGLIVVLRPASAEKHPVDTAPADHLSSPPAAVETTPGKAAEQSAPFASTSWERPPAEPSPHRSKAARRRRSAAAARRRLSRRGVFENLDGTTVGEMESEPEAPSSLVKDLLED